MSNHFRNIVNFSSKIAICLHKLSYFVIILVSLVLWSLILNSIHLFIYPIHWVFDVFLIKIWSHLKSMLISLKESVWYNRRLFLRSRGHCKLGSRSHWFRSLVTWGKLMWSSLTLLTRGIKILNFFAFARIPWWSC